MRKTRSRPARATLSNVQHHRTGREDRTFGLAGRSVGAHPRNRPGEIPARPAAALRPGPRREPEPREKPPPLHRPRPLGRRSKGSMNPYNQRRQPARLSSMGEMCEKDDGEGMSGTREELTGVPGLARLVVVDRTGSTNDDLRSALTGVDGRLDLRAAAAWPHISALWARRQDAGRGRAGRRWITPPGSALTVSFVLRPLVPAAALAWLPLLAGLAVRDVVDAILIAARVPWRAGTKWPNDVVLVPESRAGTVGAGTTAGTVGAGTGTSPGADRDPRVGARPQGRRDSGRAHPGCRGGRCAGLYDRSQRCRRGGCDWCGRRDRGRRGERG